MEQKQLLEILKFIHLQVQELLQLSCAGNSAGSNTVDYLVVAGGGLVQQDNWWWWRVVVTENLQISSASGCSFTGPSPLGGGVFSFTWNSNSFSNTTGAGGAKGSTLSPGLLAEQMVVKFNFFQQLHQLVVVEGNNHSSCSCIWKSWRIW